MRLMLTLDDLRVLNGHVARLAGVRKNLDGLPPESRPQVFALEERIRALGCEPGATQWPAPPEPTPPVSVRLKLAA